MRKYIAPLALGLTLGLGAAQASTAAADLYGEAIWDIHAAAQPASGSAATATAGDIHREAVWDIHAGFDDRALAKRFMATQRAAIETRPADAGARSVYLAE